MKTCLCALLACLICATAVLAGNWPAWRGPEGNGRSPEKDLPLQWSKTDNIRWKVPLPDEGNSSPIVWGDRIFLTQATERVDKPPSLGGPASAYKRWVMCFRRADGKLLWQRETVYKEKESTHPTNPFCSASPVTDGERVIACHGSAGLVCYDLDGKELWRHDLGRLEHIWGNASSPILYNDLCIIWAGPGERQFLRAVNKKTGKQVWQHDEPGGKSGLGEKPSGWLGSWTTPLLVRGSRDELILGVPRKLKGFDPKTGKELWSCAGMGPLVYTSPLRSKDGIVVAMSGFHGPALAVRTSGDGDITANRLWHHTEKIPQRIGSPVLVGDHVYILNDLGTVQCLELQTGKDLWGSKRLTGSTWASMVAAGGRLYVTNRVGDTFVLAAKPEFEQLAKNSLGEPVYGSMAVSDGELFIRSYKHLWCISEKK
jgi:outer membrane protein assembly factor BamB